MKITLTNNIYNRNNNNINNTRNNNYIKPHNKLTLSADSFQLSTRPLQNNKISFKGITKELGQIKINSAFDLIEQWQKLRWAPYYEALDDKVYPQNKEIRKANFSFLDNVPDDCKKGFIDAFKEFTGFPNLQKVSKKIQEEYVNQVQSAAKKTSPFVNVVAAGFDPTSSVGVERPFPGSDLDKAFVVLQNSSGRDDFQVINEFKGHLWFNTDQRLLSLNNENTFPEVYTTGVVHSILDKLDAIANRINLSADDKVRLLVARTQEIDPLKGGVFNLEVVKHLPFQGISKEQAKNFAYFIESVRDGKLLLKKDNLYNDLLARMNKSPFCIFSNVAQIGAKYTKPLKTKLVNREELTDNFDKMSINEQFEMIKEIIKSVSNDHSNPIFDKYFRNDYDIGESYNRLNRALLGWQNF